MSRASNTNGEPPSLSANQMSMPTIETARLRLVLNSVDETRARIEAMSPELRKELSPDWLALLDSAESDSPWICGYSMTRRTDDAPIGECGFKGPPSPEGMVEIAYGVVPEHQGQGYATEAASGLVAYALECDVVQKVWAHTLPEPSASTQVLTKCGFTRIGQVIDPDDGPVWRWEINRRNR